MSSLMDRRIKTLIDETSDAYTHYGSMNADYAAFASMAVSEFRALLQRPELTAQQLRRILRKGDQKQRSMDIPSNSWSIFMARYVKKNANVNSNFNKRVNKKIETILKA